MAVPSGKVSIQTSFMADATFLLNFTVAIAKLPHAL